MSKFNHASWRGRAKRVIKAALDTAITDKYDKDRMFAWGIAMRVGYNPRHSSQMVNGIVKRMVRGRMKHE